jgi:hypothetical protein
MNARTTTIVLGTLLLVSVGFHFRTALQPTPGPQASPARKTPPAGVQLRLPEMDFSGTGLSDVSWKLPETDLPPGPDWQPAAPNSLQSPTLAPEPPAPPSSP